MKNNKFFKSNDGKDEHYINIERLKHIAKTGNYDEPKKSGINWTDQAWNPWVGCRKVSAACLNCYLPRFLENAYGYVRRTKDNTWLKPYIIKLPSLIFVCNLSDFFIEEGDKWRKYAWKIIKDNPQHTFQILTKRPERIKDHLPDDWGATGYNNVWLGVTVEDDTKKAMKRLDDLRRIPAKIRFVSVEPIYKEFNFNKEQVDGFDWFILGGESGKTYENIRYCKPAWIQRLAKRLKSYNKFVWIKQLGTEVALKYDFKSNHGEDWDEFPKQSLKLREFPLEGFEVRNIKPHRRK